MKNLKKTDLFWKSKGVLAVATLMLITSWLITLIPLEVCAQETTSPTVYITPALIQVGEEDVEIPPEGITFTVNVTVANVTDLFNWQVMINFTQGVLNFTDTSDAWIPDDHVFSDYSIGTEYIVPPVSPQPGEQGWQRGYIIFGGTLLYPPGINVTGSGTLCQINFTAYQVGFSLMKLNLDAFRGDIRTFLKNSTLKPIPNVAWFDGEVEVIPEFPAFLIIPLFVTATAVALVIAVKGLPKKVWKLHSH